MPSAWFILELVDGVSVELLGLFWLQPTSANAAIREIATSGILDFINSLFVFVLLIIPASVIVKGLAAIGFTYVAACPNISLWGITRTSDRVVFATVKFLRNDLYFRCWFLALHRFWQRLFGFPAQPPPSPELLNCPCGLDPRRVHRLAWRFVISNLTA